MARLMMKRTATAMTTAAPTKIQAICALTTKDMMMANTNMTGARTSMRVII